MPDLLLVRPPRVLFLELKREKKGVLSFYQWEALERIQHCSEVDAYLIIPSDDNLISELLV